MSNEEHIDQAISKLYQSSKKAEPSTEIDAAILVQARERLNKNKSKQAKPSVNKWQRWVVPLSTAALVVMGVSITLKIMNQPQTSYQLEMPVTETGFIEKKALKDEAAVPAEQPAATMMLEAESDAMMQEIQEEQPARALQSIAPKAKARASTIEKAQKSEHKKSLQRSAPMAPEAMGIRPNSEVLNAPLKESVSSEIEWSDPEAWIARINQLLDNAQRVKPLASLKGLLLPTLNILSL